MMTARTVTQTRIVRNSFKILSAWISVMWTPIGTLSQKNEKPRYPADIGAQNADFDTVTPKKRAVRHSISRFPYPDGSRTRLREGGRGVSSRRLLTLAS